MSALAGTSPLPPGLTLARPTHEDAAAVTDLCNAFDVACDGVGRQRVRQIDDYACDLAAFAR